MERFLGLDLGTTTLGVAVSDSLGIAAHGYGTIRFEPGNYKKAKEEIKKVIEKEKIKTVALGYPLLLSGEVGERAKSCERFKKELEEMMPEITIHLVDERMTTLLASRRLMEVNLSREKKKKIIDEQAAVCILETFMGSVKK